MPNTKQKIQREITERFLKAVDSLNDSERQVALTLNIHPQHLNRLRRNATSYATIFYIHALCTEYPINGHWIISGRGRMKM